MDEIICFGVADVEQVSIHGELRHCSRCHEVVLAQAEHPPGALLCTHCLSEIVGPMATGMPLDCHPAANAMHCSECYLRMKRP